MKIERTEHCAFAVLNTNGRCIAQCKHNDTVEGVDCIGNDGDTLSHVCEVHLGLNLKLEK